jgi:integrase
MSVIVKGKNPNKPYTVRFWVDGKQKEKSFKTRKEASDFKIKTDHDVRAQIFIDDKLGKQIFSEAASIWLDRLSASDRSKDVYGSLLIGQGDLVYSRNVTQGCYPM